jgi:hypothetical protein
MMVIGEGGRDSVISLSRKMELDGEEPKDTTLSPDGVGALGIAILYGNRIVLTSIASSITVSSTSGRYSEMGAAGAM